MQELAQIYRALERAGNEPSWLSTVVAIEGSAYRRPGARLLFSLDGKLAGTISGGCLEREVMRTAAWLTERGPSLRTFDVNRDEDGESSFRSGCNGKVKVLIEPVTDAVRAALALSARELQSERPVALATVVASGSPLAPLGAQLVRSALVSQSTIADAALVRALDEELSKLIVSSPSRYAHFRRGAFEALLELVQPAPHVSVFGTGEDAVPVALLSAHLGWNVKVRCKRSGVAVRDRFRAVAPLETGSTADAVTHLSSHAQALAVVMTHDYEQDREVLGALLPSEVRYIGMLGPARRTQRMLTELQAEASFSPERLACVYGPAGLHLGADTPSGIALAIVAEMQAVLASAGAGFLRNRRSGIHEPQPSFPLRHAESA